MKFLSRFRVAALCALGCVFLAMVGTIGPVQRAVSQGMAQIINLAGTEQISLGYPCTVSCFVTSATLANYSQATPGGNAENALVGGDATTNLFQRGSSVVLATPAAVAYTADRWVAWGGTNTPVTVASATDAPQNYGKSFKVTKASGAGVVQVCVGQEITTQNSYRFQGLATEFDFHAKALAGFSAASKNLAVYVITGTGTDEGTANGAFSINAGGGSSTPWTGPVVAGGTTGYLIPITTTWARYGVVVPIPATSTEIMVAICYTPVGTGGSTDGFEFTGAQVVPNASLTSVAGTAGAILGVNDTRAKAFLRRAASEERLLQLTYYYQLNDPAATASVGTCQVITANSAAVCLVPLPVTMRAAPTITAPGSNTAFAITAANGAANVCTALAVTTSSTVPQPGGMISVTCTPTSNIAITVPSQLIGDAQAFNINASAEL
jgi:hypothetical protein